MNPVLESILERPAWQKAAFWLGSLAFISYVFWQFFYASVVEELTDLQEDKETLEVQIVSEQRLARNIKRVREEVKDLEIKLSQALEELPDKQGIPDLLASVSRLARDSGLNELLFRPRGENFREFYAEVPVQIQLEGRFHQIATFFDEVGHLPRIVNINQIVISRPRPTDEGIMVVVDCVGTTFRYLSEEERAAQAQEAAARRKSRGRRR